MWEGGREEERARESSWILTSRQQHRIISGRQKERGGWGGGKRESSWTLTFRQPYMITSGREREEGEWGGGEFLDFNVPSTA